MCSTRIVLWMFCISDISTYILHIHVHTYIRTIYVGNSVVPDQLVVVKIVWRQHHATKTVHHLIKQSTSAKTKQALPYLTLPYYTILYYTTPYVASLSLLVLYTHTIIVIMILMLIVYR